MPSAGRLDPPDLPLRQVGRPRRAPSRSVRPAGLPSPARPVGVAPRTRGLPPRPGLHPVRDHLAHLPQPSPPQELLGVLDGTASVPSPVPCAPPPGRRTAASLCPRRPSLPCSTRRHRALVEDGGRGHPHQASRSNTCSNNSQAYTPPPTTRQEPDADDGSPADPHRRARRVGRVELGRGHGSDTSRARRRQPGSASSSRLAAAPGGSSSSPTRCTPPRWPPTRSAARSGRSPNSLLFDADGSPVLILTRGSHRVDTAKVAADASASPALRARQARVRPRRTPAR